MKQLDELFPTFIDTYWKQSEAIELCTIIELFAPKFGCHVALTGGLLYKEGARKDCDLLFYRIRQVDKIDMDGLFSALALFDVVKQSGFVWVFKATYKGKNIDMFFPESDGGDYDPEYNREIKDEMKERKEVHPMFSGFR